MQKQENDNLHLKRQILDYWKSKLKYVYDERGNSQNLLLLNFNFIPWKIKSYLIKSVKMVIYNLSMDFKFMLLMSLSR